MLTKRSAVSGDENAKLPGNCLCTAHARQGENSVWQRGEYVFLWRLPNPLHLNQLFCNLHDLLIEFSAFLEGNAEPLSHYPTWQVEHMLGSNLIAANVAPFVRVFQN